MKMIVVIVIEVASFINLSEGSGAHCKFVYQIYPPANGTLVTGTLYYTNYNL